MWKKPVGIFLCLIMLTLTSCGTSRSNQGLNQEETGNQMIENDKNGEEGIMKEEIGQDEIKDEESTSMEDDQQQVSESMADETTQTEKVTVTLRGPIEDGDYLGAKGKNIYTQKGSGDLVQLKGVNLGGYLFQEFWMTPTRPGSQIKAELDIYDYLTENNDEATAYQIADIYQDAYMTEKDFDQIQQLGMNVVRLPFWYRNIVDQDGQFIEDWYKRLDWVVEQAGTRGLYVILDFHGAPGSQNGSDHSGIDGGENKEEASEFFFGEEEIVKANQQLYYEIWEAIANRYKDSPVVAGYDLLNEPYCTYRYNASLSATELHTLLWDVYDEAYRRIRSIDPDHIIIMEATWDPVDLPSPSLYDWTNVMYQYHNYLYDDYDNANGGQIRNMQKKVNLIKAANYDVPSYMGEFTYFNNLEAWDQGMKFLTEAGLHWTTWTYKTVAKYGNWGLYHQYVGEVSIEASTLKRIESFYATMDQSFPNQNLLDVMVPYYNQEAIPYPE